MTEEKVLEVLVGIRKCKGITQKELAKRIGIDAGYLSMIEHNKATLSLRRFLQICDTLNVSPQDVLGGRRYLGRQDFLGEISQKLLPDEMELLLGIAQIMCDRRDLR